MEAKLEWMSEEEGNIVFFEDGEWFLTMQVFLTGEEEAELRIQDVVSSGDKGKNTEMRNKIIPKMTKCISESFRLLWEEGFEETILVEPKNTETAEILDSTSVVYLAYKEYMMKRNFVQQKSTGCGLTFLNLTKNADGYCGKNTDGTFVCRLMDYEKSAGTEQCFYLYGVEVEETKRNRGVATGCLTELFRILSEQSPVTVYLQVGSYNEPAVHLYKKLGFEISEELRYYAMAE